MLIRQHDQHAFLVLPENRLAVAAANKLGPKIRRRQARLVTVVGPPGCGKSRLAHELVRSWDRERPEGKLILVTASQFAAHFAEASASDAVHQFQTRYRHDVRLFVCEDIQSLGPRKETQQQLLAATDEIIAEGGLVLLTSTRMPGEIAGLARRLVNRIHGGICATIDAPGEESRRRLMEHFLQDEALGLSEAELVLIAREYAVSPRELLGLITQLHAESRKPVGSRRGNARDVRSVLAGLTVESSVGIPEIARVTAKTFGVRVADLKSPRRSQTVSLARQTAMYLAREVASLHYAAIGDYFNRRNHSTVIHACQKIAALIDQDAKVSHDVATIRKQLESGGTL